MWSEPVPFFEDEDEEAIISNFVEMVARYPNYSVLDITRHIFKDLREPELRAGQAALAWSKDLGIKERIRLAKLNGGKEAEQLTKEALQQRIISTIEDETISYQEKKARIEGYMAIAEINGWKIKAIEKKTEDKTRRFPQIVHSIYADS
jgi:hypothetical protein